MNPVQLEALKGSPLFQEMSAADLEALTPIFRARQLAEGMTVFVENMPGESLYLIRRGAVKISRMLAEGEEKTLVVLGPEELFGEMAIIDGAPRSATARVAEEAELLSVRKADFDALCERNPALGLKLMRNIVRHFSRRIRENNEEYREMLLWALGKQP